MTAAALGPEPRSGYEVSFPLFGDDLGRPRAGSPSPRRSRTSSGSSIEGRAERHETELDGDVGGVSYTAAQ